MMLTKESVLAAGEWTEPEEIDTKRGLRLLRKAKPTPGLVEFYRANKAQLSAMGIYLGEHFRTKEPEFVWWSELPPEVLSKRADEVAKSRATDADVDIPRPEGLEYLPYQRAGIHYAMSRNGVLIGDEMGLGKTIQAIGIINADPKIARVLIVCPQTLRINWYRELRKWLTRDLDIGIASTDCFPSTSIVIINPDILHKFTRRLEYFWDLVVVDEAHLFKNPKARRTRVLFGHPSEKQEDGTEIPASTGVPAKRKVCLTGTPIQNRCIELFPLIHWLSPTDWPNWWRYAKRYCGARMQGGFLKTGGATNEAELQQRLRQTVMVRRLKADVLKDLPPKRRQIVMLEGEGLDECVAAERAELFKLAGQVDLLAKLKADAELAKAGLNPEAYKAIVEQMRKAEPSFEVMSRIRYQTAVAKVPFTVKWVAERMEEIDKLVLFAHHHDVIDALCEELQEFGPVKLYGGMETVIRQRAVDRFQNDPRARLFVGSIRAGGVGITLTAASNVAFHELDWVPGAITQAEDRTHRIGQRDSVTAYHLVIDGTLDANMAETIVSKQDMIDRILDKIAKDTEASEPVVPTLGRHVTTTREELERAAARLTPPDVVRIHAGLRALAGVCNHALTHDGAGFSKVDAHIGHALARENFLSARQAALGLKLLRKYRGQLGEDFSKSLPQYDTKP